MIELLVVISIISLLIALLLPALERSRDVARDAACLSNTRQTAQSVLIYANDFAQRSPIHWGRHFQDSNAPLYQSMKAPDNRWMNLTYYGKMRAALTFPDYNNGKSFYCPTDPDFFYNKNVNEPAGRGLAHYPNTSWNGQYRFSYVFPAVRTETTMSNSGGLWTGIAPNYWATPSHWNFGSDSYYGRTMVAPTVDENVELGNAMIWDRNTLHDFRTASVGYWDGAVLGYAGAGRIYEFTFSNYGSRGSTHPNIQDWLKRWRQERFIP